MPRRIDDPTLFALDFAKNHVDQISLPVKTDGYDIFDKEIFDGLCKVIPKRGGVIVNDFHIRRVNGKYEAAFTWHYPNSKYTCCTQYWGDGIYYVAGVTSDNTVVRIMFDDHCISSNTKYLGDEMASELIECLQKEEEYSHVDDEFGSVKRLCRLPEKLNRFQLLNERLALITKRNKYIEKKKLASGSGIKLWERGIAKIEDELYENKQLLALVKS